MSKKKRAQHTAPRRQGDRNVETRYSGKHKEDKNGRFQPGEQIGNNGTAYDGVNLTFIPEIRIKIHELHIHMDERMESMNFNSGCEVVLCGGCDDCGCSEESDCCGDCGNTDESNCDCCGCNEEEEDGYEEE